MQSSRVASSPLFYSQIPYQINFSPYETHIPIVGDETLKKEDISLETRRKYEDFVSKLLDENKKLIELVDFQKQEITNLHHNFQTMKYVPFQETLKTSDPQDDSNPENDTLENKYLKIVSDLTNKNETLLYEKEKLEENNRLYLAKINELYEENGRINSVLGEQSQNGMRTKKEENESKNKYGKIMDLITEIGEKEKDKEDLLFRILDLENKVHQLLMENDKLHKFIQEINY